MPRAVDPSLAGGGLPLTNDPLVRLGHNVVPQPMDLLKLLQQMLEGLPDAIENLLFPAIEQLTGIDMSMFLPLLKVMDLDFSSPQAFLESLMRMLVVMPGALMILLPGLIDRLIAPDSSEMMTSLLSGLIPSLAALPTLLFQLADALIKSGVGLLSTLSPLNALNLFNIIPVSSLGLVGYSHIGDSNPNLLANPSFDGAESVQGSGIWFYDDTVGRTTPGSVYTVADGTLKQLISNPIPVSPDQKLDMSAYCEWSGLVYTGTTPIQVRVMKLLSNTRIGPDDVAAPVSPAANQTSWLRFGAEYVAPAGCDAVCLLLTVNATATAGTIRFDDGDVHKTGKLKIPWVDGLPEELQATLNQIQALLDSIFQTFAQTAAVGNTLDDLMMALASIPFGNILGIGGPANVGGSIQGTWDQLISGLVGSVGGVGAGLADLFNVGFGVSSSASKGRMSWDILGVRNNKSIDSGMLATSEANFALSKIALLPTAPTIAVTQSASTIAFLRMAESNDKGVVSWLGSGTTNITACYVNIWQMDPATGDMTLVHRSHNIIANLSTSMAWVIYEMPGMLATKAGEVYGIEITIQGIGTHTVTGMTTWIPTTPPRSRNHMRRPVTREQERHQMERSSPPQLSRIRRASRGSNGASPSAPPR